MIAVQYREEGARAMTAARPPLGDRAVAAVRPPDGNRASTAIRSPERGAEG
ncbi:hypothetical protein [Streptomyces canus]|uniref:hypothetical protein n=1 Tax=Streptomyces canus TaxID=58343 RepID=UPI000AB08E7D|nr:hypothetical protein [Streptomyces canus]